MIQLIDSVDDSIREFVAKADIKEEFAEDAKWKFVAYEDVKPIGLIFYISVKDVNGKEFPRLVHVIIDENHRKSGLLNDLFNFTIEEFKKQGINQLVACVYPGKPLMEKLALKYGFLEFLENEEGKHFYKNL